LVALRVVTPTPSAVVLHGLDEGELWEHAASLARVDGFSLALCDQELADVLDALGDLP
jgi:putative transcriptional regulator